MSHSKWRLQHRNFTNSLLPERTANRKLRTYKVIRDVAHIHSTKRTRLPVPSHFNQTHDNHSLHTNQPLHNIATVNAFAATRPPDCLSSGLTRNANAAHNNNLHTPVLAHLRPAHQPSTLSAAVPSNATSGLLAKLMVMLHVASRQVHISWTGTDKEHALHIDVCDCGKQIYQLWHYFSQQLTSTHTDWGVDLK
jgi:hypothetical protein